MFNKFNFKEHCSFKSNSNLSDLPRIVPKVDLDSGAIRNVVEFVPQDIQSPLSGLHYEAALHSLRAKLNMGLPLSPAAKLSLDDFSSAHAKLLTSEQKIYEVAEKRKARVVRTKNTTTPDEE